MSNRVIFSMYWGFNTNCKIISLQRKIFDKFELDIRQDDCPGKQHGTWLTEVLEGLSEDQSVLFLDIDAFPLNREIVEHAFRAAEGGHILGAGQVANQHDQDFIYAGPMFLCLSKRTWLNLGKPSLEKDANNDVGQALTRVALAKGVQVELLHPTFVGRARWRYANRGVFGYATIYDSAVFHLFESRRERSNIDALIYVAEHVLEDTPMDLVSLSEQLYSWKIGVRNQGIRIRRAVSRVFREGRI